MAQRKKKRGRKKQMGVKEKEEEAKWGKHYSSNHQILLVGEGDFSFSLSLAHCFGSASNIVASSLDSYDDVTKKYKQGKSNLDELQKLGACLLHGVDATKMKLHSDLRMRRFDRVIFNFPHAGFHGKEDDLLMIEMHRGLVLGFFKNASCMLRANGEIHVNHKTTAPFSNWNLRGLASQGFLTLIECAEFKKEDYPGYNNKRGDSHRCDEPFPLGKCSTFKFIYNPRAMEEHNRKDHISYSRQQQRNLPFQEIQFAMGQLPTSIDLSYYPQTYHIPKMNEGVESVIGLRNGYTAISGGYLNNVSTHGMGLGSQRPLQHLQPMQSLQPWPTSTNVRYFETEHVGTRDMVHLPLGGRNEGYYDQVFDGNSNFSGALGRTTSLAQSASYSFHGLRPEFERYIDEVPRRTLNDEINDLLEQSRRTILMLERRRMLYESLSAMTR